jgi:outer membrane lipoprotein-sorting protein
MKCSLSCLALAVGTGIIFTAVASAADDPVETIRKAQKAQTEASSCRVKVMSTDLDSQKASTIILETVKPDQVHFRMEDNGQAKMEMWSDGKKTFMRNGPSGEIKELPASMSAMIAQAREQTSINALLDMAKDIKFVGHENVNGASASIYIFKTEMMGFATTSKFWISDADNRPLKAEGETHGELKIGAGPGHVSNKKSLTTFEYDLAIKIVVPAK